MPPGVRLAQQDAAIVQKEAPALGRRFGAAAHRRPSSTIRSSADILSQVWPKHVAMKTSSPT